MTPNPETDRTWLLAAYVLHLIGAIAGVPSLVGLLINYLQRSACAEPLASHHRWMIRSFWWGLLWVVVGAVLTLMVVGWAIMGLAWLWYLYRHVRGLIALINGTTLPA
jgi:uncharacterized membrane protein